MKTHRINARRGLFVASIVTLASSLGALGCSQGLDFDALSKDRDAAASSSSNGDDAPSSTPNGGDAGGASAEGSALKDAGRGAFCGSLSPAPTFCDDFDSKPIGALWDGVEDTNGIVGIDTVAFDSAPSSLAAKTSASPSGQSIRSVTKKSFTEFTGKPITLRMSFAMRVDQVDPNASAQIVAFGVLFGADGNFNQVVLNLNSTGSGVVAQVAENAQGPTAADTGYEVHGPFSKRPPAGDWTDVRIEIDVHDTTGTGNSLRVYFDQEVQYDGALVVPLKGGTPRIELGIGWANTPSAPWSVRYDNVVVDLKNL
jgi:hypothetical protein